MYRHLVGLIVTIVSYRLDLGAGYDVDTEWAVLKRKKSADSEEALKDLLTA